MPTQDLVVHSQEGLVASQRSQLELQRQLATQFEVDLTARDELVSLLSTQLQEAEAKYKKEVERRQGAMRVLQRKVAELEKLCRGLEEEVERSREETFERSVMEDMVKQNAENEVMIGSMKERLGDLTDETERLRLQVQDLKQESTDKDMKLLQFAKARAQDKEDKEGLNIALDSKQQELELLKRKLGVKGTGGSTPAPNRVGLPDLAPRRQSVAFVTPTAPRPKHSSSVSISKAAAPATDTPSKTGPGASLRRNRVNSSVAPCAFKLARPAALSPPGSRRNSRNATPSPASISSLSRSTSARPRSVLPVSAHRRSSSVISITVPSEDGEKENIAPLKATRTSMVLA